MRFKGAVLITLAAALLVGCTANRPPVDSQGKTPQQVVKETYTLILQGQYAQAQSNFSPKFIQALITNNNQTFIDYCAKTRGWHPDWLKARIVGGERNENLWRVKLIPDNGKGDHPGIVHDLYMVDGKWTIVFWGHYAKTYEFQPPVSRHGTATASLLIQ